ncbi:hypothetical protein GW17_00049531 [Ensete ventricosum]|nr:hypothetical protein GW17_00049531 [Ensete ventricosum]
MSTVSLKNTSCVKSCAKSSFVQFFVHRLKNLKYWSFPMYLPMGSRTSMVSRKNVTVINFIQSRLSIGLSYTISETQNIDHF